MGIASKQQRPLRVVLAFAKAMDLAAYSALAGRYGSVRVLAGERRLDLAGEACRHLNADAAIFDATYPNHSAFAKASDLRSAGYLGAIGFLDAQFAILRAAQAGDIGNTAYFTRDDDIEQFFKWATRSDDANGFPGILQANGHSNAANSLAHTSPDQNVLRLTPRERQVSRLLALGLSIQQIAAQLHLSASTIDNHKVRLMKKLEVHNRSALIHLAIRTGLIDSPVGGRGDRRSRGAVTLEVP
jgi:DNA-binding NarL/FixJ family response regulator